MHGQTPRNLPWLEQLALHIPGYGGYLDRGNRRAADRVLRDAIARRLTDASKKIEHAIRGFTEDPQRRTLPSEVNSLERVRSHIERIAARLKSAGSGTDAFYSSSNLDAPKADNLHAIDLALFERAEAIVQRFDTPDPQHDFLPNLERDLNEFEQKLDERANLLLGIK
jgi:hypothetical protein